MYFTVLVDYEWRYKCQHNPDSGRGLLKMNGRRTFRRRTEIWRCRAVNWACLPFSNDSHLLGPAFTAQRLIANGLSGAVFSTLVYIPVKTEVRTELLLGRQNCSALLFWKVGEGRGAERCLISSSHRRKGGRVWAYMIFTYREGNVRGRQKLGTFWGIQSVVNKQCCDKDLHFCCSWYQFESQSRNVNSCYFITQMQIVHKYNKVI